MDPTLPAWIAAAAVVVAATIAAIASVVVQIIAKRREHQTTLTLKVMELALRMREGDIKRGARERLAIFPIEVYMTYIRECAELAGKPGLNHAPIVELGRDMETLAKLILARDGVDLPPSGPRPDDGESPRADRLSARNQTPTRVP